MKFLEKVASYDLKKLCAPEEMVEELISIESLKYEMIVEVVQYLFDENLAFLDYFDLITEANIIHLFLARAIIQGHNAITTNFDYMIELALKRLLDKQKWIDIIPVITKDDFFQFQNPQTLIEASKYPVYKIHGAKKNIITEKDTTSSLVTTIRALGKDREKGETFAIEPYKKPAVQNLMKDHILIVMGYSGNDDFDIGPVLRELKSVKEMIWIDHAKTTSVNIFKANEQTNEKNVSKIDMLLSEIANDGKFPVFKIITNTSKFVADILSNILFSMKIEEEKRSLASYKKIPRFCDWIGNINPDLIEKYQFAAELFLDLNKPESSERCCRLGLDSVAGTNSEEESFFYNNLGVIYRVRGDLDEALSMYKKALKIDEYRGDLGGKGSLLNNIAMIYDDRGDRDKALELYEDSLKIADQLGNLSSKATRLINIGTILRVRGNIDEACSRYSEALEIYGQLGDLSGKASALNNLGRIYDDRGDFERALANYMEAYKIADELGDLDGKATKLINIGSIHRAQGNLDEAHSKYSEALEIYDQIGDLSGKATAINNLGRVYDDRGDFERALANYMEAYQIADKLGDLNAKAIRLNNIGMVHLNRGNLDEALSKFLDALDIHKSLGSISSEGVLFNNIGFIYKKQGNLDKALEMYEETLQIDEKLGDLRGKAIDISNIGSIYESRGEFYEALSRYIEASQIAESINDLRGVAMRFTKIGRIYENLEDLEHALEYYNNALNIFSQFEIKDKIKEIKTHIKELQDRMNSI